MLTQAEAGKIELEALGAQALTSPTARDLYQDAWEASATEMIGKLRAEPASTRATPGRGDWYRNCAKSARDFARHGSNTRSPAAGRAE
jgi:hypothetical protein